MLEMGDEKTMDHGTAVFWLGDLDRGCNLHAANGRSEEPLQQGSDGLLLAAAIRHRLDDRMLVECVMRIFDDTLDLFIRRRDAKTHAVVDGLAMDVLSCIRCYLEAAAKH